MYSKCHSMKYLNSFYNPCIILIINDVICYNNGCAESFNESNNSIHHCKNNNDTNNFC